MNRNPIPRALIQATIHASEGVSVGMQHALREDPDRSLDYVPMLVTSHLALSMAIQDYHDMMLKSAYVPGGISRGSSRRVSCPELDALSGAVEMSLNRLFDSYSDLIPTFAFPQMYANEIGSRLRRVIN